MMDFFKYMEWKERTERRLEPYFNRGINKRLKYAIYIFLGIVLILLILQFFFLDPIDYRNYVPLMLLRGFAGVFAIIAFILTGVLVYRVNSEYFKDKAKVGGNRNDECGENSGVRKDGTVAKAPD